ncbi:hypothetical protein OG21DRAFT_138078 [Imleria badia]|nr:hypothetical protein OG21DRAFT_138078 [Imleria badia]
MVLASWSKLRMTNVGLKGRRHRQMMSIAVSKKSRNLITCVEGRCIRSTLSRSTQGVEVLSAQGYAGRLSPFPSSSGSVFVPQSTPSSATLRQSDPTDGTAPPYVGSSGTAVSTEPIKGARDRCLSRGGVDKVGRW